MEIENIDINADEFLPAKDVRKTKAKKRAMSEGGDSMQIDEATGIEGSTKRNFSSAKKSKKSNADCRKIPVPPHRFVVVVFFFGLKIVFLICFFFQIYST